MRRALAIDEASFGDAHPSVARDLNNLAQLLQDTNRLAEAEPLMRRALAIDEASFGDAHPNGRDPPQQPGPTAAGHQPLGRSRAADAPRAGESSSPALGDANPELADAPQSEYHRLACRSRAAAAPRAGDRRGELRRRAPQSRDRLNNLAGLLQA
jgi:hypothetical protein